MKPLKDADLRIGNIVLDSTRNVTRVESIIPAANRTRYGQPLTEEYLKAFGFKYGDPFSKKGIEVFSRMGKFKYKPFPHTCLRYVHQLQNLYYLLTGKELEICQ